MRNYTIRNLNISDINDILCLQAQVYERALLEGADFYLNRLYLSGQHCWIVEGKTGILGYLIAYPWTLSNPPNLNDIVTKIPARANSWFIHDFVISPVARGQGISHTLLHTGQKLAEKQGLKYSSLVSLAHATQYWRKQGYIPIEGDEKLKQKLHGYEVGARYMSKSL